ncbi:unnamed protein product, partial [Mesorhabditis belari]|uniref:Uncharacterized protein n=1 Tax=Mesorhabditis belari TaxID=2138241 RepID=A0AAF3EXW0_9BILA
MAPPSRIKKKVVFLGESGVGKTSIVLRYDGKGFDTSIRATLGASYLVSTIPIAATNIELQIWDTAGQERFRSMVPIYLRKTDVAILVYDITDIRSFDQLNTWVHFLRNAETNDAMKLVLIGNKTDLEMKRTVDQRKAIGYAAKIGASYHETSAASNTGIEEAFFELATQIVASYPMGRRKRSEEINSVTLNETKENSSKCC